MNSDCICNNKHCPLIGRGFRPYVTKNRNHWKYSFLQGKVIPFDGNISSGKSSIGKETARVLSEEYDLPAVYIPEYVDIPLLTQFIQNMKVFAYSFQLFMLERRAETYRRAIDLARLGHIVILDRMMHGDLAFAHLHHLKGNITDEEYDNYRARMQKFEFNDPALTVFLDVTPETALRRQVRRNRENEKYNLEYFQEIHQAYQDVIQTYRGHILHIPYDDDLLVEEITGKAKQILDQCIDFLLK